MANKQFETLTEIANGLYVTPTSELPFDKRFRFKSFILQRSEGNVMIYHSGRIDEAAKDIQELDGVDKVLMNHQHESLGGETNFDAPYYIHEDDKQDVTDTLQVTGTFKERQHLHEDLEVRYLPLDTHLERHYICGIMASIAIYSLVTSYAMKVMNGEL